ncbi:MAG: exodeoxyribonuclease III, partial [Oceanicaulis sp.]
RELIPEPEKVFTWWSYRNRDFRKSNRGRRLDHIWVTPALKDAALRHGRDAFRIWDQTRAWEKPSDHAPVTLKLAV